MSWVRTPERISEERREAFLYDLHRVQEKHGITLSHEDGHGSFLMEPGYNGHPDDIPLYESTRHWVPWPYDSITLAELEVWIEENAHPGSRARYWDMYKHVATDFVLPEIKTA